MTGRWSGGGDVVAVGLRGQTDASLQEGEHAGLAEASGTGAEVPSKRRRSRGRVPTRRGRAMGSRLHCQAYSRRSSTRTFFQSGDAGRRGKDVSSETREWATKEFARRLCGQGWPTYDDTRMDGSTYG
jgi:hypothetical protein